ncbi:proto-oncogene c-Fos-like [Brachionus plicatilis]|uniref:Proto-oncogene c-Fos-like n=1 Tax=Brachionus plicatilis TaxID=10195 RepID=A0A3M7S1W1_BRAPC|nr:proto-oncogene c-Fos-like [Brachionus plicatilis]
MIQMPPNFYLFATSSKTPPPQANTITNPASISNPLCLINSEDSLDDLPSLDYNMSDSNSYGHGFDDLVDYHVQPLLPSLGPVAPEYQAQSAAGGVGEIKTEPGYSEDTQSSFNSPRPVTEKVVNKKNGKEQIYVKWGPIKVRPRQRPAPTLASGRKSKNTVLSPDEERKREERRKRNREAAEKCKQNRESVVKSLERNYESLVNEQKKLLFEQDTLLKEKGRLLQLLNEEQAPSGSSVYNAELGNAYQPYVFASVSQYPAYPYQINQNQYYMNSQQSSGMVQSSHSTMPNYSNQMQPASYNFDTANQWNQ